MKHKFQLILLAVVVCTNTCFGQQVFLRNAAPQQNRGKAQKVAFERDLAVVIGDMQRSCELSPDQVKKLKLAAKGAVASAMEKFEQRLNKQQQAMAQAGIVLPQPVGAEAADDDEQEEAKEDAGDDENEVEEAVINEVVEIAINAPNAINLVAGGPTIMRSSGSTITNEPRWKAAVKKVVSEEQQAKYAAAVKKRVAFARKSNVAAFIARVDHQLLLSDDQRAKLTTLVDEEFGARFAKQTTSNFGNFWINQPTPAAPPIARQELKSFLDADQVQLWQRSFEAELNHLKRQPVRAGVNGVFRAAPAVRAIRINPPAFAPDNDQ